MYSEETLYEDLMLDDSPCEDDCFISQSGRLYSEYTVSMYGKYYGTFKSYDDALIEINHEQDKRNWWTNIWFVNDHGNVELVKE